jgi:carbonic anhydrase
MKLTPDLQLPGRNPAPKPETPSAHEASPSPVPTARRRFLLIAVGGAVLGWVAGAESVFPEPAFAQSALSPDAALEELLAGNKGFTSGKMTADEHDLDILKQNTIEKRNPLPPSYRAPTPESQWN